MLNGTTKKSPGSSVDRTVFLQIKGLGHVPSFKNAKRIYEGKVITEPRVQKWMEQAINTLLSQLLSLCRTEEGEIQTICFRLSWIASLLPEDDSCIFIRSVNVTVIDVDPGEEGAMITIQQYDDCNQTQERQA